MLSKAGRVFMTVFILSFALMMAGVIIWYFVKASGTTLQDVMFWVGAIPIALFSVGKLGAFARRGDASYHLSRSAGNASLDQRNLHEASGLRAEATSGLNWVLAGLLVWLFSYFM